MKSLFKGKMQRVGYFIRSLIAMSIFLTSQILLEFVDIGKYNVGTALLIAVVVTVYAIFYMIMCSARRLNDLNHNTWFCLAMLIPYVNFALWIYLVLAPSKNNHSTTG